MDELNASKAEGKRKAQEKANQQAQQEIDQAYQNKSGQYSKQAFGAISKIRNGTNNIKVNILMAPMFWFDEEYKEDMQKIKHAQKSEKNSANDDKPKNNQSTSSNGHGNNRMMND